MGVQDHQQAAAALSQLQAAVLTISDTRTVESDHSGQALQRLITAAGHAVAVYRLVPNDPSVVGEVVRALASQVDFVMTTGGTGMSPRDLTIEACRPLFAKELEGFGELFRLLSFQSVGAAAMLSRASAGTIGRSVVFCLPGSQAAVELAAERLILPEIKHVLAQVRKV